MIHPQRRSEHPCNTDILCDVLQCWHSVILELFSNLKDSTKGRSCLGKQWENLAFAKVSLSADPGAAEGDKAPAPVREMPAGFVQGCDSVPFSPSPCTAPGHVPEPSAAPCAGCSRCCQGASPAEQVQLCPGPGQAHPHPAHPGRAAARWVPRGGMVLQETRSRLIKGGK